MFRPIYIPLKILIIGLLLSSIYSCNSKKATIETESKFIVDSIYSKALGEYRKHNVYLPKGFSTTKKYPIIYATDGGTSLTDKKALLDSLITQKIIKPLIFIASFSNPKIADSTSTTYGNGKKAYLDYRNFEYVDRKPERVEDSLLVHLFNNHKSYFTGELIPQMEIKYHQKLTRENRYFYGVSNGAGFGASMLNANPDLIGTYLCFSTFGGDIQTNTWKEEIKYPKLYLYYGTEEFFLKDDADYLQAKYTQLNLPIEVKVYEGGHGDKFWSKEFISVLTKEFKPY
ncbi:esterase family protein [Flavobacterium antarcticum]|uniref:alpha/beta hydrolase n=1 Tax=Flavobacterium antarcticum TaxID=271155 RepID=UPI0003B77F9B|nr:alpha/beta hydrolase-fold protein [Flavobacterium antarcticum]